ncbi:DUF4328 domain-containing protein [Streptomyces sp. TS71-3]|uniref:DUF4328 domain-containing protein n=1 Tax=Streptomyces sp. TS71-3 TaxID=2733862 RepID=UPI001B15CD5E|nr:DUF4328 domain-containing protein [Streptomyces sp. TS71-3]GHJ41967.1 hypothetical protein Sm713_75760 [Streptomyces sp. TS71-3]
MIDHTPHSALLPVRGRAAWATGALVLAAAAWTARAGWQLRLASVGQPASGPPDQGDGRHRVLTGLEDAYHLVAAFADALTVLCALTFLAWLLRVRDNARALSGSPPRYGWPWVYAGWILPIADLWIPRGIVADAYRATAPGRRLPACVNWWWGLWLVGLISGVGLMYADSTDDVIARAYGNVTPLLVADAAVVGAAVAAVLVVRALTAMQEEA